MIWHEQSDSYVPNVFDMIFIGTESQFNDHCLKLGMTNLAFNKLIHPSGKLTPYELRESIFNYFPKPSEDTINVLITVDVMALNLIHSDDRPDNDNIFIYTDDNEVKTAEELEYNLGLFSLGDLYAQKLFFKDKHGL